jgi:hypothetical protein
VAGEAAEAEDDREVGDVALAGPANEAAFSFSILAFCFSFFRAASLSCISLLSCREVGAERLAGE